MSRTFKDKKEERAKRRQKEPELSRSYRQVLEHGFREDLSECGAAISLEDSTKEEIQIAELELPNAA